MSELVLISARNYPLQPLIEGALANELRLLGVGIRRTEQRLQEFEREHKMSTAEFISRYENDELEETLEFAEWVGEYRLLTRLREKAAMLQEIQFAH